MIAFTACLSGTSQVGSRARGSPGAERRKRGDMQEDKMASTSSRKPGPRVLANASQYRGEPWAAVSDVASFQSVFKTMTSEKRWHLFQRLQRAGRTQLAWVWALL